MTVLRVRAATGRDRVARVAALAGVILVLAGCAPAPEPAPTPVQRDDLELTIGALLPQSGALAALGPSSSAGVALAAQDINDADLGITVTVESRDSGDATTDTAVTSVDELLDLDVSVIVGALSDGVSRTVIDQIVAAGVVEISPGNVSADFTGYDDNGLYWRTAPSCALEGTAMGQQIADDGVGSLGIIYETGFCESGLPGSVTESFERAGGEVVAESAYDGSEASLADQVAEVVAERPDAVVVVSESGAPLAAPDLVAAGYSGANLYFVGLSIADHSAEFPAGSLVDSKATQRGVDLADLADFTDRLAAVSPDLTDFSFAAESYDAVILSALAALAANDSSSRAIASMLIEVSGGDDDGTPATTFESAARVILDGGIVDYDGPSGDIAFDENGDPAGAVIGIYQYGADNTFTRLN